PYSLQPASEQSGEKNFQEVNVVGYERGDFTSRRVEKSERSPTSLRLSSRTRRPRRLRSASRRELGALAGFAPPLVDKSAPPADFAPPPVENSAPPPASLRLSWVSRRPRRLRSASRG